VAGYSHTVIPMRDFTAQAGCGADFFVPALSPKAGLGIQKQHQIANLSTRN